MSGWRSRAWGVSALAALACGPTGPRPSTPVGVTLASLTVTSRAFAANGAIPVDYTCDGVDKSPPLAWSEPPAGTKSFVILADDPDASGGDFSHWVAVNIRGDALSVPEAMDATAMGGAPGTNGFGRPGYSGPCPPRQEMHRYYFRVFALNAVLPVGAGATRAEVDAAMSRHVLAEGSVVGTFSH